MKHKEIKSGCVGYYEVGGDALGDKCLLSGRLCSPMSCVIKDFFSQGHKNPHEKRFGILKDLGLEDQYKEEMCEERH